MPKRYQLEKACRNNPDGFGWAVLVGTEIIQGKSMNSEEAIDDYYSVLGKAGDSMRAHFFHARIATHGAKDIKGCHGFEVADSDGQSVLCHNGILPVYISKNDWRSDSRIFAEDVIPEIVGSVGNLPYGRYYEVLDGFVEGSGSKVVILTTEIEDQPLIIMGERLGHWVKESGLWWSNHTYEYSTYGYGYTDMNDYFDNDVPSTSLATSADGGARIKQAYATFKKEDDVFDDKDLFTRCFNDSCEGLVEINAMWCEECGFCQDCEQTWEDCYCYVPEQLRARAERASSKVGS